jgi:hypothetical protein
MQETYIVQTMLRYWDSYQIPVPDDFPVHPDYLANCDRASLIAGFQQFHPTVWQIYEDMYQDPAGYGLPLYEIEKYPAFSKEYRAAGHAVYRLGNLIYNLGQAGEISCGELVVDLEQYKITSKGKAVPNAPMILSQLPRFGFELTGFNGKGFDKGAKVLCIAYPDNPDVMAAFKAYSMTVSPEKHDNNHRICKNFYMFHYRLLSTHTGEAPGSDLSDFAQVIGPDNRAFFEVFHQRMLDQGYEARYDSSYEWKVDYFKNNKYSYHFCQWEQANFQLRLKLNNVGAYTGFLDTCPEGVQDAFLNNPPCQHCQEVCHFRIAYDFGGTRHEACICNVFQFHHPKVEEVDSYLRLMELEDEARGKK